MTMKNYLRLSLLVGFSMIAGAQSVQAGKSPSPESINVRQSQGDTLARSSLKDAHGKRCPVVCWQPLGCAC